MQGDPWEGVGRRWGGEGGQPEGDVEEEVREYEGFESGVGGYGGAEVH